MQYIIQLIILFSFVFCFSIQGNQGNIWKEAMVEIEAPGSLYTMKIAFDAVSGASYKSDIAIDDVVLNQGPCQGTKISLSI